MSFMPRNAACTNLRIISGFSLIISSDTAMPCAMCGKNSSVGITFTLTPVACIGGIQSGTPAMPCDLPSATNCHTPVGPTCWMLTSFWVRPTLASSPSSA